MRGSRKNVHGVFRRIAQDQLNVSTVSLCPSGEWRRNYFLLHTELHGTDFERVSQIRNFRVYYLEYFFITLNFDFSPIVTRTMKVPSSNPLANSPNR